MSARTSVLDDTDAISDRIRELRAQRDAAVFQSCGCVWKLIDKVLTPTQSGNCPVHGGWTILPPFGLRDDALAAEVAGGSWDVVRGERQDDHPTTPKLLFEVGAA